jgi:RNA polymerase sigma factor (sigma-70 family)
MEPSPSRPRLRDRIAAAYPQMLEIAQRVVHRRTQAAARAKVTPTEVLHDAFVELDREEQRRQAVQRSLLGERPDTLLRACVGAACRDALIARLREQGRQKRGGDAQHEPLHSQIAVDGLAHGALDVHEAVEAIRAEDAELAELIDLRVFADLSVPECAELLGVSPRSVDRQWALAKAMLRQRLG